MSKHWHSPPPRPTPLGLDLKIEIAFALLAHAISCAFAWGRIMTYSAFIAVFVAAHRGVIHVTEPFPGAWLYSGLYFGYRILKLLRRECTA